LSFGFYLLLTFIFCTASRVGLRKAWVPLVGLRKAWVPLVGLRKAWVPLVGLRKAWVLLVELAFCLGESILISDEASSAN
jgi:hypothetical protein